MNDKFDKLDALIMLAGDALIEEELAYAREVLDPEIEISKRTDRRILRYIRHAQKKPGYHPVLDAMKRAAVIVLVIGTVLFASAMSIEAVREKFWNAIVEWYEDYIAVMFVDDETSDAMADVEFEVREPSYLPDGVVKGEQYITKFNSSIIYYLYGEKAILLEQYINHKNDTTIDNTNGLITELRINGYDSFIIEYDNNEQHYMIIWNDEHYRYNFCSYLASPSLEEALKMISSIYTSSKDE